MSIQENPRRKTTQDIRARKGGEPIVMLTAYHAQTASIVDPHCDITLVGDSLGNVLYAFASTVPVTLDMMIMQAKAVMRGSRKSLVIVDLPFGSYEGSKEQAFQSAARVMKESQCGGIKLEGGTRMEETIAFLTNRGIPVMAHIGLMPQSINAIGSFRALGREEASWGPIENDARAVTDAGAFSILIEAVSEPLGRHLTELVPVPTIGIGAGIGCDGQVLVLEDLLGITPSVAKFVKRYADLGSQMDAAVREFAKDVRERSFPSSEHSYQMKSGVGPSVKE